MRSRLRASDGTEPRDRPHVLDGGGAGCGPTGAGGGHRSVDHGPGPRSHRAARSAGQWREGDPEILVALDAGYDAPRIAHLLGDLPVQILDRLRSDRVMRWPTPRVYDPRCG
ncbi:transposase [Streptomyces sp. NPDC048483]|uniref:transposase n=1 Tax=Streptomyces sp. NPDC048483 TaxID=3154927 RepID=UPI003438C674